MGYILNLRYTKLLSYWLAKSLQVVRQESHKYRYNYYYGLQVIIGAINKIIMLVLLGLLFNCLTETLIVTVSFGVLRIFAGGFHFKSYTLCTYFSLTSLIVFGILSKYITLNIIILLIALILFIFYAPVENANRPIKPKEQFKFKIIAIINLTILTLLYILFKSNSILWGVLMSEIIILPIFNKGEHDGKIQM